MLLTRAFFEAHHLVTNIIICVHLKSFRLFVLFRLENFSYLVRLNPGVYLYKKDKPRA